jgi:Uma2 family endonuclease
MSLALNEIGLPLHLRPDPPMTDAEFMRFCAANEPMRFEREANGEIIVMSPTGFEGGSIELNVGGDLREWALRDGRGVALGPNSGCKLPDGSVRAADAAWVSWGRRNSVSDEERKGAARIVPEFVVEVRSESDRLRPLREKMLMWIANGVDLAWLIDPEEKSVTIYRPGEQPEHLAHPTSVQGTGPIAGFELVMSRIWE